MKREKITYLLVLFFVFVFCLSGYSSATTIPVLNFTQADSLACINDSIKTMEFMAEQNFNTLRLNDTINTAREYYNVQLSAKLKGKTPDYSKVKSYCDEVTKLSKLGLESRDQIVAFLIYYNSSITEGMNTSTIDKIVDEINLEMDSERYEQISGLIDKAYTELGNVRATYTALGVFYKNTATGLKNFLLNNWIFISVVLVILIVSFFIYRTQIRRWLLNREMQSLEVRKKTIKELIMQTQKDFFQYGKIPESDFNIKTKKFAELIRDIDRQIPMIKEELAKIGNKK